MKEVKAFEATDGKQFLSKKECLAHELGIVINTARGLEKNDSEGHTIAEKFIENPEYVKTMHKLLSQYSKL